MFLVEDVDTEDCVQLLVSAYDVFRFDFCKDFLFPASLDHINRLLILILSPESLIQIGHISQHMPISLRIRQIIPQIPNNPGAPIFLNMIIKPTDQNFLIAQFLKNFLTLIFPLQHNNLRMVFQCDLI